MSGIASAPGPLLAVKGLRKLYPVGRSTAPWRRAAPRSLLHAVGQAAPTPELHRAIGAVIGWQACDRLVSLRLLRRRWRRLRATGPFWGD